MINVRMQHKEVRKLSPKITVVGVGGAGGNAVNNMITSNLEGVEFVVCNTDAQALESSLCENKVQLGMTVTGGLGAGARPEIGRAAAEETLDETVRFMEGSNMVFITAGMGGGTGTGAAPVIARACREKGILTVGVVTKPFHFEGTLRMKMAEEGIRQMQEYVDTLIVIPNQNLFRIANEKTTFSEAFKMADSVLQAGVRGVTDLMVQPALINLDFADIRTAMMEMGKAMMGMGESMGDRRAVEAAEAAINNPLLDDVSMKGARGVIINVTGGNDMTLFEVDEACNRIRDEVDPNANIIFGATFDQTLEGVMRVSIVATGIDIEEARRSTGNLSTSMLNVLTSAQQNERKLERARPNTVEADVVDTAPAMPVRPSAPASAPVQQSMVNARSTNTVSSGGYAAGAVARKVEEEVSYAQPQYEEVAPVQSYVQQQPQQTWHQQRQDSQQQDSRQQDSMRGTRYNDSFIPPAPIEAPQQQRVSDVNYAVGAEAPAAHNAAPGFALRPPVVPSPETQKKRMPSLFERFTNNFRQDDEDAGDTGSASGESTGGLRAAPRQAYQAPQQGSLNIDAPVAQRPGPQMDDEIDIPAFLRRQAN